MQEIKKRRIVLASVLKPANEPRMFEKIGTSLSKNFEVYCIGAPPSETKKLSNDSDPRLISLNSSSRISFNRLVAPFRILKRIVALKPSLLIVCTHELLFIAFFAKMLTRCKVIYDVQENYYWNILFGKAFPFFISLPLATYVRAKEWISRIFVDHYFLAEKGYEHEMRFFGTKRAVLENKLVDSEINPSSGRKKPDGTTQLLFSGTLAETTGVFIAVDLASKLYELDKNIRLTIIGSSASQKTLDLIRETVTDHSFIELITDGSFISHERIVDAIKAADFGIISYPANPSTYNAIPTKLYEYLGYQLPILIIAHPEWSKKCEPFNAAISFSMASISPENILSAMKTREFYTIPPEHVFWSSEESKLLQTIERLGI